MEKCCLFFFNDTATPEIYPRSLHDALPIYPDRRGRPRLPRPYRLRQPRAKRDRCAGAGRGRRSEEHTSELQSQSNLVCRLLLEKKNNTTKLRTIDLLQLAVANI